MNKNVTEDLFNEAKDAGLTVAIDRTKNALVFSVGSEGFEKVFNFMDTHKVETENGMAYPVNFSVFSIKKGA